MNCLLSERFDSRIFFFFFFFFNNVLVSLSTVFYVLYWKVHNRVNSELFQFKMACIKECATMGENGCKNCTHKKQTEIVVQDKGTEPCSP